MCKAESLLPEHIVRGGIHFPRRRSLKTIVIVGLCLAAGYLAFQSYGGAIKHRYGWYMDDETEPLYHTVTTHSDLCPGGVSHSGYIGTKGNLLGSPKMSFFWLFEAQENPRDAPIILTFGGGPGVSGMADPMFAQPHCKVNGNRTASSNPDAWSEKYNLLALDHPAGVGFSYGALVAGPRDVAHEVYDFLNKFFVLYPHLARNKLVIASGSYGGTYTAHIATVINEQNLALASGKGFLGAQHMNLESLMVSNMLSGFVSRFRWALYQRCHLTNTYDAATCRKAHDRFPGYLAAARFAYTWSTPDTRCRAIKACQEALPGVPEEILYAECDGALEGCHPQAVWVRDFMNFNETQRKLGVPEEREWTLANRDFNDKLIEYGDLVGEPSELYEPLVRAGIRILHYVGKADASSAWPGAHSMLKLVPSQYRNALLDASEVRWPGHNATVRVVGRGAGNFTYVLMDWAEHGNQAELVKDIVTHWVNNTPFA